MDDRGLRPRHNRNPGPAARLADFGLTVFCVLAGGLNAFSLAQTLIRLAHNLT